ncbi:MAG: MBL fold metallo-hydrolase [Oscillospiraceae bacterium]|nr:MBL fold metallo-hydrolase [Oscillospiraceae bacterium]
MSDSIAPLEAVEIGEGTFRIEDNGVRCFLFVGTERALLVDSGFGQAGSVRAVVESLTDKPIVLVNTHADGDHIGANSEFGPAHMHPAEMPYYFKNAEADAKVAPLWEGDVIDLGGRSLEVVLIPGHTPGSIVLLDRQNRFIVSGDSISGGSPVFMFGGERSFHAYFASMEKLLKMLGSFDEIYPAHGPCPIEPASIERSLTAARKLVAGELTAMEPPFEIPAKMYEHGGAAFFF